MRISIDKVDRKFSEFIRVRDGHCKRCLRIGSGDKGIIGLQCSHYFGRGKESTRFDPQNCIALCFGCHQQWGSSDREGYRRFMIKWLGEKDFELLEIRAMTFQRKDRELSFLYVKQLIKEYEDSESTD